MPRRFTVPIKNIAVASLRPSTRTVHLQRYRDVTLVLILIIGRRGRRPMVNVSTLFRQFLIGTSTSLTRRSRQVLLVLFRSTSQVLRSRVQVSLQQVPSPSSPTNKLPRSACRIRFKLLDIPRPLRTVISLPQSRFRLVLFTLSRNFLYGGLILSSVRITVIRRLNCLHRQRVRRARMPSNIRRLRLLNAMVPMPNTQISVFKFRRTTALVVPGHTRQRVRRVYGLTCARRSTIAQRDITPSASLAHHRTHTFSRVAP